MTIIRNDLEINQFFQNSVLFGSNSDYYTVLFSIILPKIFTFSSVVITVATCLLHVLSCNYEVF